MRHLLDWSLSFGRISGIPLRLHVFFLVYVAFQLLYGLLVPLPDRNVLSSVIGAAFLAFLLFSCVLLHELGHCAAANRVGGQVSEIVLWPLGGWAVADIPLLPKYEALVAIAGPAVNLMLGLISASLLLAFGYWPPLRILAPVEGFSGLPAHGGVVYWLGVFFAVNLVLVFFNLLPGYPLDGGRLLHAYFWSQGSYSEATGRTVQIARVTAAGLILVGLYLGLRGDAVAQAVLLLVGFLVFAASEQELHRMVSVQEFAASELAWHGQELVTLDLDENHNSARPRARRKFWWERWWERWQRARRERARRVREQEDREVDRLLEKVQKYGKESLTSAELRFLKRVSKRYRSRTQPQ